MTTGQQGIRQTEPAASRPRNCYCGGPEEAVYGHRYGEGMYCRKGNPTTASPPPPLAELVTAEDVAAARSTMTRAGMRAALEAYGARLLARIGRTP